MNENDIRAAFGDTPAAFRDQVERTLIELEDMPMKKRYKISTVLIAAALAVMLLAGAAFAAAQLHLADYLRFSLNGDSAAVHTNAAVMEDDNIRCEIEEIIYDGYGLATRMKVTSLKPDQYAIAITGDAGNSTPDPDLIPLECSITGFIYDAENKNKDTFLTNQALEYGENGTIIISASDYQHYCRGLWQSDGYREKARVEFRLTYSQPDAEDTTLTTSLVLNGDVAAQKYYLTKQQTTDSFEVDTFEIVCTEAMTHCNAYIYVPDSYTDMDAGETSVKFSLIAPDGTEYPMTVFRLGIHHAAVSGWRGLNLSCVLPAIADMPDTVFVAMRDVQSGELIEQVECSVTSTELLAPPPSF